MEFTPWPKTSRLYRDVTITEKIDGTNAAIRIEECGVSEDPAALAIVLDDTPYQVGAQSRKRLLTLTDDNFGFARWVYENTFSLFSELGPGTHFGEWYGRGIQRGYGLDHRRFSLFNTAKWDEVEFNTPGLESVPILYQGRFNDDYVDIAIGELKMRGSVAAEGYENPEGICIFHSQSRQVYKWTFNGDGHKG
jgi:RNA ligase